MNNQTKEKFNEIIKKLEENQKSRQNEIKLYNEEKRFEELEKLKKLEKFLRLDKMGSLVIDDLKKEVNNYLKKKHGINNSGTKNKKEHVIDNSDTSDEELYLAHYTDIATIHSILIEQQKINQEKTNKSQNILNGLRLSSAVYSNDPTEGSYLKNELVKHYEWLDFAKRETDAFFCSFVSSTTDKNIGDKITYWQSYGKDGLGCSIQLSDSFKKDIFHRVLYEKDDIHEVKNKFEAYFKLGKKIYQDYKKYQFSE